MGTITIPIKQTDYNLFLQCKKLPCYQVIYDDDSDSWSVETDEISYSAIFGGEIKSVPLAHSPHLLDFQKMIVEKALERHRYCAFLECGLGKTPIELAFAQSLLPFGKVLILCPLSVFKQMQQEYTRWHSTGVKCEDCNGVGSVYVDIIDEETGEVSIDESKCEKCDGTGNVKARLINLRTGEPWESGIAIMNYEGRKKIDMTGVVGIVLDESSILKNDTGATRDYLCKLAENIEYRLCASATPAPNETEEYSSHAVFLGLVKSTKEFNAKFFRKEDNHWVLKGHAYKAFYEYLSTFAVYLCHPSRFGFDTMTEMREPPEYIFEPCETPEEIKAAPHKSGQLSMFPSADNSRDRSKIMGKLRSIKTSERTQKIIQFIRLSRSIIWCGRNAEELTFKSIMTNSPYLVNGSTPYEERETIIDDWKTSYCGCLISKPRVLGFGRNLPECEIMVFSGFTYSFELFYQAIRRAHRYGRVGRLKVLIPYTHPELPILNTLKEKMGAFERDVLEIENLLALKVK